MRYAGYNPPSHGLWRTDAGRQPANWLMLSGLLICSFLGMVASIARISAVSYGRLACTNSQPMAESS
jgi:hypothetical protein